MNAVRNVVGELWGMATISGTCNHCGKINIREAKVNRGWIGKSRQFVEPVNFGYMGDCPICGNVMGGFVEWKTLIAIDEVEL